MYCGRSNNAYVWSSCRSDWSKYHRHHQMMIFGIESNGFRSDWNRVFQSEFLEIPSVNFVVLRTAQLPPRLGGLLGSQLIDLPWPKVDNFTVLETITKVTHDHAFGTLKGFSQHAFFYVKVDLISLRIWSPRVCLLIFFLIGGLYSYHLETSLWRRYLIFSHEFNISVWFHLLFSLECSYSSRFITNIIAVLPIII